MAGAIRALAVRGAPLIGVAGAFALAIELRQRPVGEALAPAYEVLRTTRPTAVNLIHALDRVRAAVEAVPAEEAADRAWAEAQAIRRQEEEASRLMAKHGAELLSGARTVLTHCNTGALAAPGRGTGLAAVVELHARHSLTMVLVTETRPLLQGARLTAYELAHAGIPYQLIVDSAAAGLIASGAVDAVVVGCDRVAANGDVANKVGTYGLALAANAAGVPFVVVGPTSTIDLHSLSGDEIVLEEREPEEVRWIMGSPVAPENTPCANPAFDVTPARLVSALVTERGVAEPVSPASVAGLLRA